MNKTLNELYFSFIKFFSSGSFHPVVPKYCGIILLITCHLKPICDPNKQDLIPFWVCPLYPWNIQYLYTALLNVLL